MLYTTADQENKNQEAFDGQAVNHLKPVTATGGQKFLFYFLCVITLGIAYFIFNIKRVNQLNRLQNKINESASNIEVQLEKRYSTLTALVQAVSSQATFDKEVYENIAKFRSLGKDDLTERNACLTSLQRNINFAYENYPNLGADLSVRKLMTEASMIEKEIAAARRLYNADVTQFNSMIYTFPTNVVIAKKGYHGLNLFKAEEEHKGNVDLTFKA